MSVVLRAFRARMEKPDPPALRARQVPPAHREQLARRVRSDLLVQLVRRELRDRWDP